MARVARTNDGPHRCLPAALKPGVTLSAAGIALFMVCGCASQDSECLSDRLTVSISTPDGQSAPVFAAVFDGAESRSSIWCPAAAGTPDAGNDSCNPPEMGVPAKTGILTVRVPGHSTFSGDVNEKNSCPVFNAVLTSVEPVEINKDFATGFSRENGLAEFEDLAVESASESGTMSVVKFYIADIRGQPKVYFQNTKKHPLHYGFARDIVGVALSQEQYEATTYHGEDRTAMAGNLVFYKDSAIADTRVGQISRPVGMEFFPSDDVTPELALLAYDLISERMRFVNPGGPDIRLAYIPASTEHEKALLESNDIFDRTGALWLSRADIYGHVSIQFLNKGVAYGTLRKMTPQQLKSSPVSFRDIVLLTRLPNEVPLTGGFITEELQTPLAHVNVAAHNRGTPNMALPGASEDDRIMPFIDGNQPAGGDGSGLVRFEVSDGSFSLEWTTMAEARDFWESSVHDPQELPEADVSTTGLFDFSQIGFADSNMVGAKAANLAEAHNLIPLTVPGGFAVPFHYYRQFVETAIVTSSTCTDASADCIMEGRAAEVCDTVRALCAAADGVPLSEYIEVILSDPGIENGTVLREAALDGLRYLFGHIPADTAFSELIDDKALEYFGSEGFRLRSSTNAEDLTEFSGAGLYESVSGDNDSKKASDRIRKVWASVWNYRAYEERAFMGVDHRAVRMGVAVHRSFPTELANGVLISRNLIDPAVEGYYVNVQAGETSVTNPEGGELPEVFAVSLTGDGLKIIRTRYSSLSPETGLMTETEIGALYSAARKLHEHFLGLYRANPYTFAMDIEFKLDSPDRRLVIKQARPYSWRQ